MIEKILKFSIYNRLLVIFLTALVAAYGFYKIRSLPIDAVPDITNNQVQINSTASGLSPYEVEKQVSLPIENALAGIAGLESTRSLSRNGFSQVTAIFHDNVNIYFARQQLGERLAEAKEFLPLGVEPKMGPIATGLSEIYMWTVEYEPAKEAKDGKPGWQSDGSYYTPEGMRLQGDLELQSYLRTVQDWIIRPQLKGIAGLAGVDSIGGYVRQYDVEVNPTQLMALQLSFENVVEALERNNLSRGAGYIENRGEASLVKADGRLVSMKDIENVVVATRNGVPIPIKDIAQVRIGKEMRTGSATENGREVVIGTAMMLIGANSRTVALAVDEKMREINRTLPPSIIAKTILNRTKLVDATIATVSKNLSEGALLVIAILFALLGNFRAACLTALVIPLSLLITAIGMVQTKISGNLMSLGALDFGLIVDGAIIITENALRHLGEKQRALGRILNQQERLSELLVATKEMILPSFYGQAIILTVYLPLLTFSGVEGKMFEPMALTVIFALLAAFILSLTFVPALIALWVKPKWEEREPRLLHRAKNLYGKLLHFIFKNGPAVLVALLSLSLVSLLLFNQLGQEFIPALDEQDIALHAVRIPSTSLTQSTQMQLDVEKTLKHFPEVDFVFSKTGTAEMASDPMPPHVSDTFVMLRPREQWPNPHLKKFALIEQMEAALELLPGNSYEFTQPIEMRFNELIAGVRSDVAVKVYGDDFEIMQRTGQQIARILNQIVGAADVKVAQTDGLPVLEVVPHSEAARRQGVAMQQIVQLISTAVGGKKAGTIFEGDRRFDIVVRLPEILRNSPTALANLPVFFENRENSSEKDLEQNPPYIPLKEVASLVQTEGLNEITRENGKRMIAVEANVRGTDLGTFVSQAKQKIARHVKNPPGYWIEWGGQFQNLLSARAHLALVIPLCLCLIFALLFSALHSIPQALIVFTAVPMALTGGIIALALRGMPFSLSAAVGFIALSGIAVLNGLVMMNSLAQLMQRSSSLEDALIEGAKMRLRPVLMTALVASLGFVPMAFASGTGAEVQKPLATVVIGGLLSSTFLTLCLLPLLCKMFLPKTVFVAVNN